MHYLLRVIALISVLNNFATLVTNAETQSQQKPPDVWLESYWEPRSGGVQSKAPIEFQTAAVTRNNFIFKNGTNFEARDLIGVIFSCQASYPVEWIIPELDQLPHISKFHISAESERISDFSLAEEAQPQNKQFRTYLSVSYVRDYFNVGFACKPISVATNHPSLLTKINLHVVGNATVESAGKNNSNSYNNSNTSIVEARSILKGNAKVVRVNARYVKCCTGKPSVRPKVDFRICGAGRRFSCDLLLQINFTDPQSRRLPTTFDDPEEDDCIKIDTGYFTPGVLDCKEENIDYRRIYVETFSAAAGNITKRNEEQRSRTNNSLVRLVLNKEVGDKNPVGLKERMLILVGHDRTEKAERHSIWLKGTSFSRLSKPGAKYENWTRVENIAEYGRNSYYEGEPLKFMCFGLKYFHGFGGYLRLNWRNGSKVILKRDDDELTHHLFFDGKPNSLQLFGRYETVTTEFVEEVSANREMDSLDCFLPVVNSAEWDRFNYPIRVVSSAGS